MDGGDAVRLPGSAGEANNKLLSPPLSSLRAASHLGGHMLTVSSCDGRALSDPRVPLGAGSQPREPPDHETRKEHRWAKETAQAAATGAELRLLPVSDHTTTVPGTGTGWTAAAARKRVAGRGAGCPATKG